MCSRSCGTSGRRRSERRWRRLRAAGRQWSYATVATLLDRLETKGLVTSDRRELAFVYRPAISTQEVRQRRLTSLVDKLYQGEPGLLVLHLLKSHPLDASQAKEVRSVLDQMSGEKKKKRQGQMIRLDTDRRPISTRTPGSGLFSRLPPTFGLPEASCLGAIMTYDVSDVRPFASRPVWEEVIESSRIAGRVAFRDELTWPDTSAGTTPTPPCPFA